MSIEETINGDTTINGDLAVTNISPSGTVDGRDVATDGTKLDGIAAGAEVNPDVVPQAEAEAGTATTERIWTAERVKQAIAALENPGLVPLASVDLSAGTTTNLEFTSNIDGTYDVYKIFLEGIKPATDDALLHARFYIGGALKTGASDYGWSWYGVNGTTVQSGQNLTDDRIDIIRDATGGSAGNDSQFSVDAEVTIWHPNNTSLYPKITWQVAYFNANNEFTRINITEARYNTNGVAMDGIRFFWDSGDFAAGTAKLYGVKNP